MLSPMSDRRESLYISFPSHTGSYFGYIIMFFSSTGRRVFLMIRKNQSRDSVSPEKKHKRCYCPLYYFYVGRMKDSLSGDNIDRNNLLAGCRKIVILISSLIGNSHWESTWMNFNNIRFIWSSIAVLHLSKATAKVGYRTQKWACMVVLWLVRSGGQWSGGPAFAFDFF